MLRDRVRVERYHQALEAAIVPGMTVLDIGTGTGIHTLQACRSGAKHVWAIEPDPIIAVAEHVIKDNAYRDRVTFLRQQSTEVNLPQTVDIMVSDLRGVLPLYRHHLQTIIDARTRLLKPGGILIPKRDRVFVTLVNAPAAYNAHVQPWESRPDHFNFQAARLYAVNCWSKAELKPENCLVESQVWADLDYSKIDTPHLKNTLVWTIEEACEVHGLGAWFTTDLYQNIGFSTAPDRAPMIYGQGFFPFAEVLELQQRDRVESTLRAHWVKGEYIWHWQTELWRQETCCVRWQQSTLSYFCLSGNQ